MPDKKVIVVGSSGHARVIIDIIERQGVFTIKGLIDPYRPAGADTLGYEVIGSEDVLDEVKPDAELWLFVAIGDNWIRKQVVERLKARIPQVRFISVIHPSAVIGRDVHIGEGVAIMAGAVVNPCCHLGDHTLLNTNSSLDHDCQLQDFASLAPNAAVGGNVNIGHCSAVSIGATVSHGLNIGEHAVIGAGAVLLGNCADRVVMYGVPARKIRERSPDEEYL